MRISALCAAFAALSMAAFAGPAAAQTAAPANAGFEQGAAGEAPPDWTLEGDGWRAEATEAARRSGRISAAIAPGAGAAETARLSQTLDATGLRGRRVRLRAALRGQADGALWLSAEGPDGAVTLAEGEAARPGAVWSLREIAATVPTDARTLTLGVTASGAGPLYLDAVSLEDWGEAVARPLAEQGVENLAAFARLYGAVRFFHPGEAAATADWTQIAMDGIAPAETAPDAEALRTALMEVFAPVAPGLWIGLMGASAPPLAPTPEGAVAWRHTGLGMGDANNIYESARVPAPEDMPDSVTLDLGAGLAARVPLKAAPAADPAPAPGAPIALPPDQRNTRAARLASIIVAWNAFQHFYPYWDTVDADWPAALRAGLRDAAAGADADSLDAALQRLTAASRDGHARATRPQIGARLPLEWDWIEDALVITAAPGDHGLRVGDVVTAVDGAPVEDRIAELESRVAAGTPGWRRFRALQELGMGAADKDAVLTVQRADGTAADIALRPDVALPLTREARPEPFAALEPGVVYIDLSRIEIPELTLNLNRLRRADGLVLDLRGYPSGPGAMAVLQLLADGPMQSARFRVPVYTQPDQHGVTFDESGRWDLQPARDPLTGVKAAFLTDARAISFAESIMGIVEAYELGEIVGGRTAGTNGNINRITLPTGHILIWTGMQVVKHDGSPHHGVGIAPTIPAERTIAGVRAGRDEVLEAGIAAVRP